MAERTVEITNYRDPATGSYRYADFVNDVTTMAKRHSVIICWENTALVMGDKSGWLVIHNQRSYCNVFDAMIEATEDMLTRRPALYYGCT